MKKVKLPKLGRRGVDSPAANKPVLSTSEDYLEQGSTDEESGDRWLGSDLAKSLRFYQKAYNSYLTAIDLDATNVDGYYNSCRLLFHVYCQYCKTDGVNIYDLVNVDEALNATNSVVVPISKIVSCHERAIEVATANNIPPPLDLLFNTTLVYTEVIELEQESNTGDFNEILNLAIKCQNLFAKIIEIQVSQFQSFVNDLLQIDSQDLIENQDEDSLKKEQSTTEQPTLEEYASEEVVQPTDIYDSILSAYKLVQAVLENVTDIQQIEAIKQSFSSFLSKCNEIATDIVVNFSEISSNKNEMVANLSQEQIYDINIAKTVIEGLCLTDITQVIELWNQSELPDTATRYMEASDNIQTIIDRLDIAINDSELFWKSLTYMTNSLKKAQDLLQQQLTERRKSPSELGLGQLITQISNIMIARADIDIQRSQISIESAIKNQAVLVQNAKTLLKNAMNLAKTPGGLRERISEKLQREKALLDSVLRMCILEGKTSVTELDSIMGRDKWTHELPELVKLGYYEPFGINKIEIPPLTYHDR